MIWAGSSARGSLQSFWFNLGADLIGTMLAVFLLAPIIERAELRRESVLERFNHSKFIRQVERARREVRILELWTDLLQGGYQKGFSSALREVLSRRVEVRVLLLSPESPAVEQRADDLRRARQGVDVEENIKDNLRTLCGFLQDVPKEQQDKMEVRIYSALPPVQMYQVDDYEVVSFYPVNAISWNAAQYQTDGQSQLGQFVGNKFDELWEAASTRTLEQYCFVSVEIEDGAATASHRLEFVNYNDATYLGGQELVDSYANHGIGSLRARVPEENARAEREISRRYRLIMIEDADEFSHVTNLFASKYGPDPRNRIIKLVTE
jgi:hypothetical protein